MGYIYKIINNINSKVYVGQTNGTLSRRWSLHKQMHKTHSFVLYRAMRKYGIEHFTMELIEECDDNLLDEREKYWINYYDSYNNGYNMTLGGTGGGNNHSKYEEAIITIVTDYYGNISCLSERKSR